MTSDRTLTCAGCSVRFVWTAGEQAGAATAPNLCHGCRHLLPPDGRRRGVIKFYNVRRGWGFITQLDGQEIFLHRSCLAQGTELPLEEGELVEYAIEVTARGPQAFELSRLQVASGRGSED